MGAERPALSSVNAASPALNNDQKSPRLPENDSAGSHEIVLARFISFHIRQGKGHRLHDSANSFHFDHDKFKEIDISTCVANLFERC